MKTESLTQQAEQKDIKQTEQTHTELISKKENETETVTEGITTTYDTEKPADPQTGKPPVKSETKWKQETKEKAKEESAHTGKKDTQSEDKSRIDTKQAEQAKAEQSQKKDVFWVPWFWTIASGCIVVGVGIYLKRKI